METTESGPTPKFERIVALTDLREFFLLIKRRFLIIATITAFVTACFLAISLTLPERYKASAIITLDSRKTQVTNLEDVVSNLPSDIATVRSEINIIKSRTVIDRAMKLPGIFDKIKNEIENEKKPLPFLPQAEKEQEAELSLDTEEGRTAIADYIQKNLAVSNDGRSYTITVSYQASSAALAAEIANAVTDSYLTEQLSTKYATTERADEWLGSRIDGMRKDVEAAETEVEDFKASHNLVGVGESTLTQQQLLAVNSRLVEARASLSEIEARLQSVEKILKEKGNMAAASTVLSSPLIQTLQGQEAQVRRREAELSARYGDRHPNMINARAELRDIRSKISEEVTKITQGIRNEADAARARVASLEKELGRLEGSAGQGSQDMVKLRQLQREAEARRNLYEVFLERSKQVSEQRGLQVSDARVTARATPPVEPFFPQKSLFGILGIMVGGMISLAIVLLVEYFDRGFRSMNEIERMAQVPCIGMIPLLTGIRGSHAQANYVVKKPLSAYAEALRTIYTAVHFSGQDKPPKVLMVTSSVPHEGKTTFSVALSRLMAKTGSKVLLIDGDLRHPRIHDILKIKDEKPDIINVLKGEASIKDAIREDESGAHVVIAKNSTMTPQNLLGSQQMKQLLEQLRADYDLIVLDTPPVLAVADVAKVAHFADASLYVVKWGSTPYDVVLQGLRLIKAFKINLAGVVMTQVNLKKQSKFGYGDYGHYYKNYSKYYTN